MPKKILPPIQCFICQKEMLAANGSGKPCRENSQQPKPSGWRKLKDGKWLCNSLVCRGLFYRPPKEA